MEKLGATRSLNQPGRARRRKPGVWLEATSATSSCVAASEAVGLFDQPDDESSTKVLVAALAGVGVLFTATEGVLELLLKDPDDQRTTDLRARARLLNQLESERNLLLAQGKAPANARIALVLAAVQWIRHELVINPGLVSRAAATRHAALDHERRASCSIASSRLNQWLTNSMVSVST